MRIENEYLKAQLNCHQSTDSDSSNLNSYPLSTGFKAAMIGITVLVTLFALIQTVQPSASFSSRELQDFNYNI